MKVKFLDLLEEDQNSPKMQLFKGEKVLEIAKEFGCLLSVGDGVFSDETPALGALIRNGADTVFLVASGSGKKINDRNNFCTIFMKLNPRGRKNKLEDVMSYGKYGIPEYITPSRAKSLFMSLVKSINNVPRLLYLGNKLLETTSGYLILSTNRRRCNLPI